MKQYVMLSIKIQKTINRNPYCKEWRESTAIKLYEIGMDDNGILLAIEGNMDSKKYCYNYCIKNNLPFWQIWNIIKGNKS